MKKNPESAFCCKKKKLDVACFNMRLQELGVDSLQKVWTLLQKIEEELLIFERKILKVTVRVKELLEKI